MITIGIIIIFLLFIYYYYGYYTSDYICLSYFIELNNFLNQCSL